jgi:phage regulator Rha-like protein
VADAPTDGWLQYTLSALFGFLAALIAVVVRFGKMENAVMQTAKDVADHEKRLRVIEAQTAVYQSEMKSIHDTLDRIEDKVDAMAGRRSRE